ATFIVVELMRRINLGELDLDDMKFTAEDFAKLIELGESGKISKDNRKIILREMIESGKKPADIAEEQQLWIKEDNELLEKTINDIMAANPKAVEQYRSGETKVFGFLMGQCNKILRGAASPASVKAMLEEKLKG
ncbi:MAG: Asp-tRNA(Asn)/Glu-tRNA(Gln) amidotransferase GatCAB subunit B, partial [Ruminiclostridium sp.]|nr:Asp-tRNA(Asn)/Glu-tRNA(Gln) amidotransferase GatCAB subunit B [Ruminiclostridium sp.]